ncbi:UBP-type zinc finger domain-containing protein [Nocardioides mesophilus]|uniref:UBP-type zinc finger domain-containing protein n=1 Tax=Nocardioides mesophilus TaxID=433659 RepID=A0A7G9RB34_9ACTN|nr:UBP-type zinc finger domain-containing protein [Nocardioides mesophilus]QNN52809.1 UBP-type zinc finger domain-containing protein [Nocardioides mesophilus]
MDDDIDVTVAPSGTGCLDCDAADPPGWWMHLRRCAACGHIGCCDSSPAQHASAHARATSHRYIQSFEPGETWWFDYRSGQMLSGPELAAPTSRPDGQPSPGPQGRVPPDWRDHLHG